jgi:hypothetical protein
MTEGPRLVKTGVSGSTPVFADVRTLGSQVAVRVTLSANYLIWREPGIPSRPSFTGSTTPDCPRTIPSGTVLLLHQFEADALVAAGGAVYS